MTSLGGVESGLDAIDRLEQRYLNDNVAPRDIALESVIAALLAGAESLDQIITAEASREDIQVFSYMLKSTAHDILLMEKGI